ncbi:MAG: sulfatase [Planctomycetales bacterium]|nr:sulfatase [Planctomycetales bacterium]
MSNCLFCQAVLRLFVTCNLFFIQAQCWALGSQSERPNFIIIFVDDQGYYDLGCYGATEIETPNIDWLANSGIRFTDYYAAAPICSPSRAGLLTGCYPRRVGLATWVQRADSELGLHPAEVTFAELLQQNGYRTACIGKWHLGFSQNFLPHNQGFDEYFGLLHNLDPVETIYFDSLGGVPLMRNQEVVKRPPDVSELTRIYTDESIAFVERNRDRPFFLYLAHTMLHLPLGVSQEFRNTSQLGEYGDAIHELDFHVGRLLQTLREHSLDRNTVIVYASDNGREGGRTSNQPLRGRKLTINEAGIRVPCIAWGPSKGIVKGQVNDSVVHAMDWYPTLATFAEIPIVSNYPIDGRDLSTMLQGSTADIPGFEKQISMNATLPLGRRWNPGLEWKDLIRRDEYLNAFFYHGSLGELAAVRSGKWKLHLNPVPTLYDLEKDPAESKPLANPQIIRKLRGMAILFQEEMLLDSHPRLPVELN